ncbi:MAG: hypothetical protein ACSHYA_12720 [Opitutaceae bacterium]
MKFLVTSLFLLPLIALGLSVAPNYAKIYENADIFAEGYLSGKELSKIKVSDSYNSATSSGNDQFYILTELIVDGRIQFNGRVIAPDGYLQVDGKEKEFYKVYAKDGVHLNEGNTKETKAWFISKSALPRGDSMFCLGAAQIDDAERTVSEYMSKDIGSQDRSQNVRKKKESAHGGDLMFSSDDLESISVIFAEDSMRVEMVVNIPAESIVYQIKKNPNLDPVETGEPQISSLHIYIDEQFIAENCAIFIDNAAFGSARKDKGKTTVWFRLEDGSDILQKLSELNKKL